MTTRTLRSKRGPKLTRSSVKAVATTLATSTVSSATEDLTEFVLDKVAKLPELDLYSERKKILGDSSRPVKRRACIKPLPGILYFV